MKLVTVNGKKVYSDKDIKSILGTRITYTDGSWCDIKTGKIVHNGPGYISIGSTIDKVDTPEIIEKSYNANTIGLISLSADVNINVGSDTKIKVKIEGRASVIKDIEFSQMGNTLGIRGKDGVDSSRLNIVSGGGSIHIGGGITSGGNITIGDINLSGRSISIGKLRSENETKITVCVPKGTEIDVSDIQGHVNISDIEGNLRASVTGGNTINAGRVKDAVLSLHGGGDICVQEVNGSLTAKIAGSGDIQIKKGNVTTLNATVTGSGDIIFGGRAKEAILAVTGSGDIQVAHVHTRPILHIIGSGEIDVGNW